MVHGDQEWEAWKTAYGRNYATPEEEELRHKAFLQNMLDVQRNQEANPLAKFGSDEFSDWTESELMGLYGAIPEESTDIREASVNMTAAIPDSKDWTGTATTPVKKQKCGSCWANSAVEQIESDFILQKGAKFVLSPQELVDCKGDRSFRNGCQGGWPSGAYEAGMQLGGFELEADYPDEGKDSHKKPIDTKCMYKQAKAVLTINGWQYVGKGNEQKMKAYVGATGPLSVCVNAAWKGYKSGVMTGCPSKGIDHCVQIVGYGTNYWKVRNSWGASWGEKGHIRLAFGSNQCGINLYPTSTTAGKVLKPSPTPSPTPPSPPPSPSPPSPGQCGSCKVCYNPENQKCQADGAHRPKTKAACEAKGHIWCGSSAPVAFLATSEETMV
jgi:cathepsin F